MLQGFLVHPLARVGHGQEDVLAGVGPEHGGRVAPVEVYVFRLEGEDAPFGHGVAGIHAEVHEDLL